MQSSGKKSSGLKTVTRPRGRAPSAPPWDPNAISAATRDEVFPFTAAGVVLGFGTGMTAMVLGATVVNRWFVQRKGLVMGLLAGSSAPPAGERPA